MGTDGLVGVVDILAAVDVLVVCCVWEREGEEERESRVDELDVSGVRDEGGSSFSLSISLF